MRGAGGGRPAKPEGQKVNRHPSTKAQVTLPRAGRPGKAPSAICELTPAGRRLWSAMWRLPEATRWGDVDIAALSRLVWLQQDTSNWADSKLLAEIRQLEDRFGMNAHARQMLGWSVEGESDSAAVASGVKAPARKDEALRLLRGEAG